MHRRAFLSAAACCAVSASTAQLARAQTVAPRFADAARYSADRGGASFLVVRHGIVLAEDYPGGADQRWPLGAGTRAFAPLLAASLVEDRLLSLDEPVAFTLGDWGAHPVKSTISVRALLNGTSGIGFGRRDDQTLATAMALEPIDPPGVRFISDAASYLLFAEIARRKLLTAGGETDPARYLTMRTLLPIGCVPIGWMRGADGRALRRWRRGFGARLGASGRIDPPRRGLARAAIGRRQRAARSRARLIRGIARRFWLVACGARAQPRRPWRRQRSLARVFAGAARSRHGRG